MTSDLIANASSCSLAFVHSTLGVMGSTYPHLVFVYGTLKTGEPNHHVLQDPTKGKKDLLGVGETVSKYPLVVASRYNIPYLLDAPGKGLNIKGNCTTAQS